MISWFTHQLTCTIPWPPSLGNHSIQKFTERDSQPLKMFRTTTKVSALARSRPLLLATRAYSQAPMSFFQQDQLPANTVVRFVPQQTAWVVERMGKFHRILEPGLAILIPFLDKIQYVQSLKEAAIEVPSQSAITADNVTLEMDGVLYIRVVDAYKASYGVEDAEYAISQLAQTTMRSEIGQLTLDHVLKERQSLNNNITAVLNEAAADWGIKCLRYEIKDIHPPQNVLEAMHRQVSAERSKRAEILDSEGHRQAEINIAEGKKAAQILASEAVKSQSINEANGEAEAILVKARATAKGIAEIANAINNTPGGKEAVSMQVAEHYVEAFGKLAKESNTVVIPAGLNDMGSFIAGGMSIYNQVTKSTSTKPDPKPEQVKEIDA
ncbi:CYFA0S01e04324g1_1 [Cyberlindnera fabianii]|uniref:CYFA0S01e04324g1_1 n=1 Tax=Cyberlindnera fabianii TaxID=36022 RepID=A0A061APW8_CYBFA|nr:CYFA0S01e04324g1_1 [Cyberlindnera fabianii]